MGLHDKEQMQQLYDAGVRKYHCNLETSPSYFPKLCSTRMVAPKCTLHFAGGRARMDRKWVARILRGGANGAMLGNLLTTGNDPDEDFAMFEECDYFSL